MELQYYKQYTYVCTYISTLLSGPGREVILQAFGSEAQHPAHREAVHRLQATGHLVEQRRLRLLTQNGCFTPMGIHACGTPLGDLATYNVKHLQGVSKTQIKRIPGVKNTFNWDS